MIPLTTLIGRPVSAAYDPEGPRIALELLTPQRRITVVARGALATDLWTALGQAKRRGQRVTLICSGTLDDQATTLFLVGFTLAGEPIVRSA